jgi:hypothetical protein
MNEEVKTYGVELNEAEIRLAVQVLASAQLSGNLQQIKPAVAAIESLARKFLLLLPQPEEAVEEAVEAEKTE